LVICLGKSDPIELKILQNTKFTILYNISKNQQILRCVTIHVVWVSQKLTLKNLAWEIKHKIFNFYQVNYFHYVHLSIVSFVKKHIILFNYNWMKLSFNFLFPLNSRMIIYLLNGSIMLITLLITSSNPHFLAVNQSFKNSVDDLVPNKIERWRYVDMKHINNNMVILTLVVINASRGMQFNISVVHQTSIK